MTIGRGILLVLLLAGLAAPMLDARGALTGTSQGASLKSSWIERLRQAHRSVDATRARHAKAKADYGRARHRNRARGDRRAALLRKIEESEAAVKQAEQHLEELREEARRTGVPPGWIRDAEREGPASRQP